jgi:deazaflavin-dependent oxidoreductase (nitroreductase family)
VRDDTARRLSALHRRLYRATGGRLGRRLVNNDMLLLETRGRRSGRRHTVPLLYLRDGADLVVIASWGGRDEPPDWYRNLLADAEVEVQVGSARFRAHAAPMAEPERSRWWETAVAAYEGYATYQGRTERIIPVVRLRPLLQATGPPTGAGEAAP